MKTTTKKLNRWVLAAAATLLLACTTMAREAPRREWYQDYEEALRAIEKDNPRKAVTLLGAALAREPRAGLLKAVRGIDEARRVDDIEDVIITAHITQEILPPPEGGSYLGFIFSRAETPDRAEAAVRASHAKARASLAMSYPPTRS